MNKLSRLTALLLALLMLLSSTGVAEAAAGIAFGDFDAAAFNRLSEAASLASEEGAQDDGKLSYPCDEMPQYCLFDEYSVMTATQMHAYFNDMYYEDGDGEISERYAAVMIHYGEYHLDSKLICECGVHPMPEITVGDITEHETTCPWHFANLTVEEQYNVMRTVAQGKQNVYYQTLSAPETATLNNYVNSRAIAACGPDNVGCTILTQMLELSTPQERYDFLMALEEMDYKLFIWHYSQNHHDDGEICDCELDEESVPMVFAPGSDEHLEGCVWHKDNLGGNDDKWDRIESVGNTSVSIKGNVPENVTLELDTASISDAARQVPVLSSWASSYVALDISLMDGDEIWQPANGEIITVEISADDLGSDGDKILLYHIHEEDGITQRENLGVYEITDGKLTFDINGFSMVVGLNCSEEDSCFVDMFRQMQLPVNRYEYLIDKYEDDLTWYEAFMAHYNAEHAEDDLICTCATPVLVPGTNTHDESCAWHEDNCEVAVGDLSYDGVQLVGKFTETIYPSFDWNVDPNAVLIFQQQLQNIENPYKILDVILYDSSWSAWQPDGESKVKMTIDADGLGNDGDHVILYHVHVEDDGTQSLEILGPSEIVNGLVTFELTQFSYMLFIGLDIDAGEVGGGYVEGSTYVPSNKVYNHTSEQALAGGEGEVSLTMGESDRLQLSVSEGSGQWQVLVGDVWVNFEGETGSTFDVTGAKLSTLGKSAEIRWISADGTQASQTAVVEVVEDEAAEAQRMLYDVSPLSVEPLADEDGDEPSDKVTYTIMVQYLYDKDKSEAYDPYTATVAANSNFRATVKPADVEGYDPYIIDENGQYVLLDGPVTLSYSDITEDKTVNVYYKPADVGYTVFHHHQNVMNDDYTVVYEESVSGYTEDVVVVTPVDYAGFKRLKYETPTIAADGSTEVHIYYDRLYYLMTFDLGGGYGVNPIYARYGATIGDGNGSVGTPSRAGYTFKGWSLDGSTVAPLAQTMPAQRTAYIALWEANATAKVTVVFWGENADDEKYSHIKSAEVNVKPGTEFTYSDDGSLICGVTETHTHSDACGYDCGKTEHTHSIQDGCYELTCTQEDHNHINDGCELDCSHTHTTACYRWRNNNGLTLEEWDNPGNTQFYEVENGVYRYLQNGAWRYAVKIGETYYRSDENNRRNREIILSCSHSHDDSCYTCGETQTNHVHTVDGGCYTRICTDEEHVHSADCGYLCGKTEHQHTSACYMAGAGLNSNLWKFVRSETVTVEADGSTKVNVYYDRAEKTLTFQYDYGDNRYRESETITKKWGANIATEYTAIAENAGSTFWSATSNGNQPYTNYFEIMPENSKTYYNRGVTGSNGSMQYYGEDLNGQYSVNLFTVPNVGGYTVTKEDRYSFDGFTYHHGTANGQSCSGAAFYYTRNSYNLVFNDGYDDVKTESVKYEATLSTYKDFVPTAPSSYQAGSVKFDGWYLNPECTGEEYILEDHKMPSANVLLFAKWIPVDRTVTFYIDEEAYLDPDTAPLATETVKHGAFVENVPEVTNGNFEFIAWFYVDENGNEVAVDFSSLPITTDLEVYAKWYVDTMMEYIVFYKTMVDGEEIEIAAPRTGWKLALQEQTFEAKVGTDLNEGYQDGYFPTAKSHTMTIAVNPGDPIHEDEAWYLVPGEIDEDGNPKRIQSYTFWYESMDAVPYTVKYINRATGKNVFIVDDVETTYEDKVVSDNRKSVVTETYQKIKGYMPEEYQIRLVISADGVGNEIIFYYNEDKTHAYYTHTHYTQNLDGSYSVYAGPYEYIGDIGETYEITPFSIPGFTCDYSVEGTLAEGELTADGLDLKLYYTRNSYPYEVHYMKLGTEEKLADSDTGEDLYGQQLTFTAKTIANYTLYSDETQSMVVQIEPDKSNLKHNVIIFYYEENMATIDYVAVGPEGATDFGSVNPTSEMLYVLTGTAAGSTAVANTNYSFVGWYSDVACTTPVDASWVDANDKIVPQKDEGAAWVDGTTYYAKFVENKVTLNYKIVGPDGTVDDNGEADYGSVNVKSEQVNIVTGAAQGSTADPSDPTYKFVGWYSNEACTDLVSANLNYVPTKGEDEVWVDGMTYYAKFEYNIADLTITKTITGYDANCADDVFTFNVTLDPGAYIYSYASGKTGGTIITTEQNPTATIHITGQDMVTIKDIVITSEYTVEEINLPTGYTIATAKVEGMIAAENNNEAFANIYSTGDLEISKTVDGTYAPKGQYADSFAFTVTLPDGTYTVEGHDTIKTLTVENQTAAVFLKGGEKVTITGIPDGASYTVVETANDDYTTTPGSLTHTGTIEKDETREAAFTNTYKDYPLTINKRVEDNTFTTGERTFTFEITLPTTANEAQRDQFGESPKTVEVTVDAADKSGSESIRLPAGDYVVTEKDHSAYTVKMRLADTETETDTITATVFESEDSGVTVTNTRIVRDVTVNKEWEDENDFHNLRAAVSVELTGYDPQTLTGDDWTYTWTDVPVYDLDGEEIFYTVTEEAIANYETTYAVNGGTASAAAPTLDLTAQGATVTVTNKLPMGELTITKSGLESGEYAQFTVSGPNGEKFTVVLEGVTGQEVEITLANLREGTYSVTETDWSWTYEVASAKTQSDAVSEETPGAVTFANIKKDKWLYDEGGALNTFDVVTASETD